MKKIIFTALILSLVLFIITPCSLAKGKWKRGAESLICAFEGDITGLEFDFGDGFPLDLGLGIPVTITYVEVEASGQELTVVYPFSKFIYNASLSEGWGGAEYGKIFADATLDLGENGGIVEMTLEFQFEFATIFEQFRIKRKDRPAECADLIDINVPKRVDLFFEVTNAQLIGAEWPVNPEEVPPFNFVLVIDKGRFKLVDTFEFLTP